MKTCFTDGEMSNLAADYGQLLCACICDYDPGEPNGVGHVWTYTLKNYGSKRWDDKSLAKEWRDHLQEYDVIVGWNSIKFDIPFLNTRLRYHGLKEVKIDHHIDLMYTAKFKLRLSSARLDTVARYLRCADEKTYLDPAHWTRAMGGHRPSYQYIIHHCRQDVKVLGQVYDKTKKLIREIK